MTVRKSCSGKSTGRMAGKGKCILLIKLQLENFVRLSSKNVGFVVTNGGENHLIKVISLNLFSYEEMEYGDSGSVSRCHFIRM